MQSVDLNLIVVLDALLQEGSVAGAARRLHLTPPAVSRSLGRLRAITGDPLLVRAGRHFVPTPVADRLREPTHDAVAAIYDVLSPSRSLPEVELESRLDRVFTVRTGPDNALGFGAALLDDVRQRAPRVRLTLLGDADDPVATLRDGLADLVLGGPPVAAGHGELHRQTLLTDTVVVIGRRDGAFARTCADRQPTLADLARHPHVNRSPRSVWHDAVDHFLTEGGLARTVVATAPGFAATFALVRQGDLVCLAPDRLTRPMLGDELCNWPAPITLPQLVIEQCWHHRNHSDPEHGWLRDRVRDAVATSLRDSSAV